MYGILQRENHMLRDFCITGMEPTLEHCMKVWRKASVIGWKESCF